MMFVFLSLFVAVALGQSCPSGNYVYCAGEGGRCTIPDTINEGYMSYGTGGRYNLIPFTNGHSSGALTMECDNDHGDIIHGRKKACCYIAADLGIGGSWSGYKSEGNSAWYYNSRYSQWTMRYGTSSRYTMRVMEGYARGWCNNGFFNDPFYGTKKSCNHNWWQPRAIPSASSSQWKVCGNEGHDCKGLSTSGAQWVKYGASGHYYMRLVISKDGKIPCNNGFFDDPKYGTKKYCYRAPARSGAWSAQAVAEMTDFDEDLDVVEVEGDDSVVETDGEMYQDSDDVDSELFSPYSAPSDWTITINSYDVTVVLALMLVVLCSTALFMVACSRKSSKMVYSPVKFMGSDNE